MAIDVFGIPHLGRNITRVVEIATVLAKYGFADQLHRVDRRLVRRWLKDTTVEKLSELTHEARIRLVLTELGTTFIKLGQMLGTRRDLVGSSLADELTKLQAHVPADPFPTSRATIEAELKRPLDSTFATFERTPLASASIGQVHRATLPDGRAVAVKVQHPDIASRIRNDLSILREMARLGEEFIAELRPYRPVTLVAEFERALLQELDFRRELRHLQIFIRNLSTDDQVRFPAPIPEFCTSRVLVMEYLSGTSIQEGKNAISPGYEPEELARRGARVFLDMIFRDGFYHADPHPGNLIVLPGGVLGILDGGMIGRVGPELRSQIEAAMVTVVSNDPATLADVVVRVGEVPPGFQPAELEAELAEKISFYWGMPLDQFQLGVALEEATETIRRYQISLRPPLAMLLKMLVMLEGTTRLISPRFNLVEVLDRTAGALRGGDFRGGESPAIFWRPRKIGKKSFGPSPGSRAT